MFLIIITLCLSLNAIADGTVRNTDQVSGPYEHNAGKLGRSERSLINNDAKNYLDDSAELSDADSENNDDRSAQSFVKRPFVFGTKMFGKRTHHESRNSINKRPFVIGNGYTFGKRSDFDFETRPYVIDDFGMVVKRPFVLGSGFKYGKRDVAKYVLNSYIPQYDDREYIEKRPFVLSGGYHFGKRNQNKESSLEKRPFVLGSGYGYGKRSDHSRVEKRPFVLGSSHRYGKRISDDYLMDKRPFVLGGYGKQADEPQNDEVEKRPFVLGGYGKREKPDVEKRPFVLSGFGKRRQSESNHNVKRPFVLGNYGKREDVKTQKPFVIDGSFQTNDGDSGFDNESKRKHLLEDLLRDIYMQNSDVDKRPFVLGGYGKRYSDVEKRPFVLGKFGKRNDSPEGHAKESSFAQKGGFGKEILSKLTNADFQSFLQKMEYEYSNSQIKDKSRQNGFSENSKNNEKTGEFEAAASDTNAYRADLRKRPFILGGPYTFGKVYELGKRGNTREEYANDIFKRPFVLSNPYRSSTNYKFGKRSGPNMPFEDPDNADGAEIRTQKRPFVLRGGGFLFRKRPYSPVSQYQIGKRDTPIFNNDELSDYVYDFTMDKRARGSNGYLDKRPFVFGGGPNFGKRSNGYKNLIDRNVGYFDDYLNMEDQNNKYNSGITYDNQVRLPISALEFDRPQQYIRKK